MKKKEFINSLLDKLSYLELEEINKIISYYEEDIKKRLKKGEKEKKIIESYGSIDNIISNIRREKRKKQCEKFKQLYNGIKTKISKYLKELKKKIKTKKNAEIKPKKENHRKEKNITKSILTYIVIILFFINNIFLFTMIIAFIDGVKLIGIIITLISLSLLYLIYVISSENYFNFKYINQNIKMIINISVLGLLSAGISLTIYDLYKIEYVNNISNKYTMYKSENKIRIDEDLKNFNIYFNSYYKNNYDIVIDEELTDSIKIEIKYFECMNDLNYKINKNSVYISLTENIRDIVNFYLTNLKEQKIYNYKELSRYEIVIYMSSKNKEKIDIHS